jgi:hypothetical protein|tara:strand:+ start:1121 stop:1540 length:420 start_codon:yes stop_codon:yes gene_type:complete
LFLLVIRRRVRNFFFLLVRQNSSQIITSSLEYFPLSHSVFLSFLPKRNAEKEIRARTRAHAESERVEWSHPLLSSSPRARVTRVQERGRERKRIKARIGEKECRQSAKDVDTAPTALALARKEEETKRDDAVRDKILLE